VQRADFEEREERLLEAFEEGGDVMLVRSSGSPLLDVLLLEVAHSPDVAFPAAHVHAHASGADDARVVATTSLAASVAYAVGEPLLAAFPASVETAAACASDLAWSPLAVFVAGVPAAAGPASGFGKPARRALEMAGRAAPPAGSAPCRAHLVGVSAGGAGSSLTGVMPLAGESLPRYAARLLVGGATRARVAVMLHEDRVAYLRARSAADPDADRDAGDNRELLAKLAGVKSE